MIEGRPQKVDRIYQVQEVLLAVPEELLTCAKRRPQRRFLPIPAYALQNVRSPSKEKKCGDEVRETLLRSLSGPHRQGLFAARWKKHKMGHHERRQNDCYFFCSQSEHIAQNRSTHVTCPLWPQWSCLQKQKKR